MKKEITIFSNIRKIYRFILSNEINENNIEEFINILKSNEYFINNDNFLIKFYKTLLEQKESLKFLQTMKNFLTTDNAKENQFLNKINVGNLINLYIIFKRAIENENIISDKDFNIFYDNEIANNAIKKMRRKIYSNWRYICNSFQLSW